MTNSTTHCNNTRLSWFVSLSLGAILAAAGIIIAVTAEPAILTSLGILLYLPAGGFLSMGLSRLWSGNRSTRNAKKRSPSSFLGKEVTIPGATPFLEASVARITNWISPRRVPSAA